ncbi:MAG: DoxX family protein [Flavobacteriales bacterium]
MTKRNKIIYWVATIWLALGMVATGIQQLLHLPVEGALAPPGVYGITQLGYPVYFLTILGVWKLLGVLALLVPKFPLVKEWAYAGFFFLLIGALFSHIATHHSAAELFPSLLLLVMTALSWYFRPDDRRIAATAS